jgi:hypothetical protein
MKWQDMTWHREHTRQYNTHDTPGGSILARYGDVVVAVAIVPSAEITTWEKVEDRRGMRKG